MITGIFHKGSGLGNQLHRYVFTRVKAMDLGVGFMMMGEFKGSSFLRNMDLVNNYGYSTEEPNLFAEQRINNEQGVDIRPYDENTNNISDNTIVDGEFQDEKYWAHREKEVRGWLRVEPLIFGENTCVINFRGGEYVGVKDLFLTKEYWAIAIAQMKYYHKDMVFEVHTDDPITAREFFPDYPIISDMELNWRAIRYAKYVILSNSSFGILPAWLNEDAKKIIAPMYWAGRNVGYWKMAQNKYSKFFYL